MVEWVNLVFYNKVIDGIVMKWFISRLINYFGMVYILYILD